jgi:hypothetical protein
LPKEKLFTKLKRLNALVAQRLEQRTQKLNPKWKNLGYEVPNDNLGREVGISRLQEADCPKNYLSSAECLFEKIWFLD